MPTFPLSSSLLVALSETARDVTSAHGQAEKAVTGGVLWLNLSVETVGAMTIAPGILSVGWLLLKALLRQ